MIRWLVPLILTLTLTACDPSDIMPGNQSAFVDQGFKSTIAAVEVYRLRNGHYPENLDQLAFTGDWFPIFRQFVSYRRLENGYQLNVSDKMAGELEYPPDFFSGLGLARTNVRGAPQAL